MGRIIKENNGKYQIYSTTVDDRVHKEEWITKEEAMEFLILEAFDAFMKKTIEIYMSFPKWQNKEFFEWLTDIYRKDDYGVVIYRKYTAILEELGIEVVKAVKEVKEP